MFFFFKIGLFTIETWTYVIFFSFLAQNCDFFIKNLKIRNLYEITFAVCKTCCIALVWLVYRDRLATDRWVYETERIFRTHSGPWWADGYQEKWLKLS